MKQCGNCTTYLEDDATTCGVCGAEQDSGSLFQNFSFPNINYLAVGAAVVLIGLLMGVIYFVTSGAAGELVDNIGQESASAVDDGNQSAAEPPSFPKPSDGFNSPTQTPEIIVIPSDPTQTPEVMVVDPIATQTPYVIVITATSDGTAAQNSEDLVKTRQGAFVPRGYTCDDLDLIRMSVGDRFQIGEIDVNLRKYSFYTKNKPFTDQTVVRILRDGNKGRIIDGPMCFSLGTWWYVEMEGTGEDGWLREYDSGVNHEYLMWQISEF